ncbi:type II secretion system protein GspL [Catenovulum sp. SM1970]|uniref:type II secretion system protein GspL n=1 Tax=Marinifaba aquimaris TaxID=2741323 RepID=UPI001571FC75|nr:type II secretion system protein GspL [Marinifaba aquimaris]
MSEQLFIRLGENEQATVPWLVWSSSEKEIIASGELANVAELASLQSRASGRPITAFVSGQAVVCKQVEMPAKAGRQFVQALPFMLEEEFAQDVEELFFVPGDKVTVDDKTMLNVAVCSHEQMQTWLTWLDDAGLVCHHLIPDYLALPYHAEQVSVLKLVDSYLIRDGEFSGFNLADSQLDAWLSLLPKGEHEDEEGNLIEQPIKIAQYSPFEAEGFDLEQQNLDLPMQVLAEHVLANKNMFNLRVGQYKQKTDHFKFLSVWRYAATLLLGVLVMHLVMQGVKTMQLEKEAELVEAEIRQRFLEVYPNGKRIRTSMIKKQMKSKLAGVGDGDDSANLFAMIDSGKSAFKAVPDLKPSSFRFDAKRQEIRIQAAASNFASFEKFKTQAEKEGLTVEQGSLNNTGNQVAGTITIKRAS